jgi:hypothetical protein
MRHTRLYSGLSALMLLALVSCQSPSTPLNPALLQRFGLSERAPGDLVEVPGIQAGNNLEIKGPLFTQGQGKVHALTPDAFQIEFSIAGYHLKVSATRINEKQARFVTTDLKQNSTVEAVGTYVRTGNVTVFDMGKGSEVEKLTIKNQRTGYFETDVVQPGRLSQLAERNRGSVNLKFTRK